jgi:DNA-binding CsgD family transcriptional regulator
VRVVVVSDRLLSSEALVSALAHIPDACVVAMVNGLGDASLYCENGKADAVMADASVVHQRAAGLAASMSELVTHGAGQAVGGHLATAITGCKQRPWQLAPAQLAGLSCREHEVFVLLGVGMSNQRIAHRLGITEQTVKAHVGRILAKLQLESRLQAGLAAVVHLAQQAADGHRP